MVHCLWSFSFAVTISYKKDVWLRVEVCAVTISYKKNVWLRVEVCLWAQHFPGSGASPSPT